MLPNKLNFSKMNFSSAPKTLAYRNSANSVSPLANHVNKRGNLSPVGANGNNGANYLTGLVGNVPDPLAPALVPAWKANNAKPALPNNLQKKFRNVMSTSNRYTKKNRNLIKQWNREINRIEHPGFFNRIAKTFRGKRKQRR